MKSISSCVVFFSGFLISCGPSKTAPVETTKTCCSTSIVSTKFCEDEVAPGPRSDEAGCEFIRFGDSEFFVRFHRPSTEWPWAIDTGDVREPDIELFSDENYKILQTLGVSLDEVKSKVFPTAINMPDGTSVIHSYVDHFAHEIDGYRVLSDKSFVSRKPSGEISSVFFRWHQDAKSEIDARSQGDIERDELSVAQSSLAAKELIAEQRGLSANLSPVWVPLQDGIRMGVLARWFSNLNGESGTGTEALFIDGLQFESPDTK